MVEAEDRPIESAITPFEVLGLGGLLGRIVYTGVRVGLTTLGKGLAKAADDRVVREVIERKALGADKATSRHIIERNPDGTTRSVTHQVRKPDGRTVHQHQRHIGKHGTERDFPDEWIEYPKVE